MKDGFRLYLLGFLTLFLELACIRFLAGNIWNLGYFPNLVLLSVFIGMGAGFLGHPALPGGRSAAVFVWGAILLAGLLAFVGLFRPAVPGFTSFAGEFGEELFFTATPEPRGGEALPFFTCFVVVAAVFACISQRTAKLFGRFPPLTAYTLDIAGSICGVLAFMAVSALTLPAYLWFLGLLPLYLGAMEPGKVWPRWLAGGSLCACALFAWIVDRRSSGPPGEASLRHAIWSPYQKVEHVGVPGMRQFLFVNRIGHQTIHPERELRGSFYETPYKDRAARTDRPPYEKVLVLGAGSGNDAAVALLHGAEQVDAVEIDPVIAEIGRRYHPLLPYSDARVRLTVDDGRAFLGRCRERYDLIVFALTDSVVKVSPMAQLRLENYLFTREAVEKAFSLLTETGDLVFYNTYRRPWLVEKLRALLAAATGRLPRVVSWKEDLTILTASRSDAAAGTPSQTPAAWDLPVDDWPFLYLQSRAIPAIYLYALGGIGALVAALLLGLGRRGAGGETGSRPPSPLGVKLAFLFMGTAFLLLETKSVIQFSLLFGTTWLNSSLVFLAVLVSVLAANWTAPRLRFPAATSAVFLLLLASCLLPLVLPLSGLLDLESGAARFALASAMTFAPIFFANLLFGLSFQDQAAAERRFGWNLFGATLGGAAEYSSLLLGYDQLAWVVAGCYALAFAGLRLSARPSSTPSSFAARD